MYKDGTKLIRQIQTMKKVTEELKANLDNVFASDNPSAALNMIKQNVDVLHTISKEGE